MSNEVHFRGRTPILVRHREPDRWIISAGRPVVHWFEVVVSLALAGLVGWFIVDSLLTLLTLRGRVPIVTAAATAATVFLWLRHRGWSRRVRLIGVVLVVLAVATPLAVRFA